MGEPGEEERVEVFGRLWTGNDATGENISNVIAFTRSQFQQDPDVDPALRLFVPVKLTVGKVSTDRQSKKFSSTDDGFFCTVGIQALKCASTVGTENDPIPTEILY